MALDKADYAWKAFVSFVLKMFEIFEKKSERDIFNSKMKIIED